MIQKTEIIVTRTHHQKIDCDVCKGYSSSLPDRTKKQAIDEWKGDGWHVGTVCECPRCNPDREIQFVKKLRKEGLIRESEYEDLMKKARYYAKKKRQERKT